MGENPIHVPRMSTPARNEFKTSDIRISTDSVGCMTATHKYQGTLIYSDFFSNRAECRREAVKVLKQLKAEQ